MSKPFNIHDWQSKQRLDELNEKEGVKHYTKDGKEWTGATHKMPNGPLMTQNPHSEDSEELFHKEDLNESLNPEVSRALDRFIRTMADKYDYSMQDAVYAIMAALKQRNYDGLEEMNVTGGGSSFQAGTGAGYATPNAFKKKKKVNEVSYSKFKSKTNSSPKQKIANGINQINKMIKEVEKIVAHNFRLKTELNMNSGTFFTSTNKRVHEIGARLKRLENKLREFSN